MTKSLKILIWLYIALLIVEGALRKWVLPTFADPLLIVRDPVILAIYALALASNVFPVNRFVVCLGGLAILSALASVLAGESNLLIMAYGLRINYLHLPLIWVMGAVLDRRDVERIGTFLLVVSIPMTLVMVEQFRSPVDAFINRGVGSEEIGQIFGADGRIRPPGFFSFITGPQLFYPLCAAFFFDQIAGARRLPWYLLVASGVAIAIALPVSISRTVMMGTAVVVVAFLFAIPFITSKAGSLVRIVLLLSVVGAGLSQLPVFREGTSVFMMRWDSAESDTGVAALGGMMDRTVNGFTNPLYFVRVAPFLGHGIGTGSNVGARLTTGHVGFLLAEEEWGKVLLELGPILGIGFIGFRLVLTGWLALLAWRALREDKNGLPLMILAATALTLVQGQWGPPTVLGFAVVGAGLMLGALNTAPVARTVTDPEPLAKERDKRLPVESDRRPPVVLRTA